MFKQGVGRGRRLAMTSLSLQRRKFYRKNVQGAAANMQRTTRSWGARAYPRAGVLHARERIPSGNRHAAGSHWGPPGKIKCPYFWRNCRYNE